MKEWINTDDMQRLCKTADHTYKLIEADEVDGKFIIAEPMEVVIDPSDDYEDIVSSFYGSLENFKRNVSEGDREQLLAEMIYESTSRPDPDNEYELLTEEQVSNILEYYCEYESLPDNGYVYGWNVSNIKWDTDDECDGEIELPESVYIPPFKTIEEGIDDYLSDEYGFCFYGCSIEPDIREEV